MAFKEGEFVEIEYSSWTTADNRMIDTTDKALAEKNGIVVEGRKYGPVLVIVGKRTVVKGLDDAIKAMDAGQTKKITLKPGEAFGERNPDIVRVMPLAEFKKRDMNPYPGMRVNIDNVSATVKSVNSGRVVVDANHPYAGMEITYEVKISKRLDQQQDKITALGRTYEVEPSAVKIEGKTVELSFNDAVKKDADYFIGRANLVAGIFGYFDAIEKVKVEEEYNRPKEGKAEGQEHEHDHAH
ncbi:MAG: peptidylprolyl isomerase [Candidatus Micrarchaeota archaeon]|nr:peptidylprolyl isomerase [Candidatus Micrarchaeota archaeon]